MHPSDGDIRIIVDYADGQFEANYRDNLRNINWSNRSLANLELQISEFFGDTPYRFVYTDDARRTGEV